MAGTGPQQNAAAATFYQKTQMCRFKQVNRCYKGEACPFAHTTSELQPLPDLYRTRICKTLIKNGQCLNSDCRYAHSRKELRVTWHQRSDGGLASMQRGGDKAAEKVSGGDKAAKKVKPRGGADQGQPACQGHTGSISNQMAKKSGNCTWKLEPNHRFHNRCTDWHFPADAHVQDLQIKPIPGLGELPLTEMLKTGAATVRNTFLEFGEPEPCLMMVRTASGSLNVAST